MFQMCTGGDDWWHNKFIYTLILKKIRHCFWIVKRQALPESCYTATLNQPPGDRKANKQTDWDRGRQTGWKTDRQRDRQTNRQSGTHKNRLTERQADKDISLINAIIMPVFCWPVYHIYLNVCSICKFI